MQHPHHPQMAQRKWFVRMDDGEESLKQLPTADVRGILRKPIRICVHFKHGDIILPKLRKQSFNSLLRSSLRDYAF